MQINYKKSDENLPSPKYAIEGDAGLDLTAYKIVNSNALSIVYDTGLSFEIRDGYVGFLYPRSSIRKYELYLANSVGIIDSNYRGNVQVTFRRTIKGIIYYFLNKIGLFLDKNQYNIHDRICQLIILPYPSIILNQVDSLSDTARGENGHGSTGTK